MLILDRYLLRQFIRAFVVCFLSLTGLYIVFDAFTNLEEFLRCSENSGGLLRLMGTFYAYKSIVFFNRTSGILTLVAAVFTLSWFQRHNELTALMSAGISRIRIVVPLLAAAVAIAAFSTINREVIIPRFRDELSRRPQDLIGDVGQPIQPRRDNETDVLIGGQFSYGDQQRIEKASFRLPPSLDTYGVTLAADNAFYQAPQDDRPGGYLLSEVTEPKGLAGLPSLQQDGTPVLLTPHDADWLKPDECFLVSNVDFDRLAGDRAFRDFASTGQLIAGLKNPSLDYGSDVRVVIHTRIVNPMLDLTLLMLGLPLVISRENRNVFIAIGLCLGVVTVFLLVVIGFQYLGTALVVRPALAAWMPLLIFVPPAVWRAETMWR